MPTGLLVLLGSGQRPGIDHHGSPLARPYLWPHVLRLFEALLQNANGAKVKLTLDIGAEAPAGYSDADVSDVREMKFRPESTGFE